jgi:ferrochelatase
VPSSVAFQSRLGRDPWIRPFTDEVLVELAQSGTKRLLVACPSFVSDCLETLEEIGGRARESFRENGGDELRLVPCVNASAPWVSGLAELVRGVLPAAT